MEKNCINCEFFAEEAFGGSALNMLDGAVCSCEDSPCHNEHATPKSNCENWIAAK